MHSTKFFILCSTIALCACTAQESFSPEEVLHKSSAANVGLTSAHLSLSAKASVKVESVNVMNGSLQVDGNIQSGGKQFEVQYATEGTYAVSASPITWNARGKMIVLSENETYLIADQIETNSPLMSMSGTWFRLPSLQPASPNITPDPRLLRLQSDAVRVIKNHGTSMYQSKRMYHYDVELDAERVSAFFVSISDAQSLAAKNTVTQLLSEYDVKGELWIDQETFLLTKAVWTIARKDDSSVQATIEMSLSDIGKPVSITAPAEFEPFPTTRSSNDAMLLLEEF